MHQKYFPRITKELPAVLENSEGVHLKVTAIDTGFDSVSIQCNTIKRNIITPGGRYISGGKPIELFLSLGLPYEDGMMEMVSLRCYVAYSRRISSEQCKIGMRYANLDNDSFEALKKYVQFINFVTD